MLKKVLEGPGCAMLIQNSSGRRTKDLQRRHFGFAYCASLTSLRVFQQTARPETRKWTWPGCWATWLTIDRKRDMEVDKGGHFAFQIAFSEDCISTNTPDAVTSIVTNPIIVARLWRHLRPRFAKPRRPVVP